MDRLGLALVERDASTATYRANEDHPQATHLRALLAATNAPAPLNEAADQTVRLQLRELGAPLAVNGAAPPHSSREDVLADGLRLAHRDPSVARTFPVCLWVNRDKLDPDRLRERALAVGEKQALGFFLELTTALSGDQRFVAWTRGLRDHRVTRPRPFFDTPGTRQWQALAEQNTPASARNWHFLMNMDEDTFRSHFRKFVNADLPA
jgi:hypothetical protein